MRRGRSRLSCLEPTDESITDKGAGDKEECRERKKSVKMNRSERSTEDEELQTKYRIEQ